MYKIRSTAALSGVYISNVVFIIVAMHLLYRSVGYLHDGKYIIASA